MVCVFAGLEQTTSMSSAKVLAIGCDHAALDLKKTIKAMLEADGYHVIDVGCHTTESVDYPDYAAALCEKVNTKEAEFGFLFCGTGIGMSLAANKCHGIRAALCHDHYTAMMSRLHNDANVLCAGARVTGIEVVKEMVQTFLSTSLMEGNHARRIGKIMSMEC